MKFLEIVRAWTRLIAILIASGVLLPVCVVIALVGRLLGERIYFGIIMVVTVLFLRLFAFLIGIRLKVEGERSTRATVFIGNHFSYLDILVMGIAAGGVFIAQHKIRDWPLIGWFASLAGTVFINRNSVRSAEASQHTIGRRAGRGVRMIFFPEGGIKTVSGEVTTFRAFLFGAVASEKLCVQPVAIRYTRIGTIPIREENRSHVFWNDKSSFINHAFRVLGFPSVHVTARFLPEADPPEHTDKESLREYAEQLRVRVEEGVRGKDEG